LFLVWSLPVSNNAVDRLFRMPVRLRAARKAEQTLIDVGLLQEMTAPDRRAVRPGLAPRLRTLQLQSAAPTDAFEARIQSVVLKLVDCWTAWRSADGRIPLSFGFKLDSLSLVARLSLCFRSDESALFDRAGWRRREHCDQKR